MREPPLSADELLVSALGPPRLPSPLALPPAEDDEGGASSPRGRASATGWRSRRESRRRPPPIGFEKAGPRAAIYFDPPRVRAAIVTCGGLCPGTNNVIRSIFHELFYRYGVGRVLGIRYGFQGLNPAVGVPPLPLDPGVRQGRSTTSAAPCSAPRAATRTRRRWSTSWPAREIDLLFCVGGDGTQRGAHAHRRRGRPAAACGSRWSASPRRSTTTSPSSGGPSASSPRWRRRGR